MRNKKIIPPPDSRLFELRNVIKAVSRSSLEGIVVDADVISARDEHQEAHDDHRTDTFGILRIQVSSQYHHSEDKKSGSSNAEKGSQADTLDWDSGWRLLEPET